MTLTDFLLARIAEEEERFVHEFDCDRFEVYNYGLRQGDCDCDATPRLLAECEAKRLVIKDLRQVFDNGGPVHAQVVWAAGRTLRHLAAPYADHPDYDEAWRPGGVA